MDLRFGATLEQPEKSHRPSDLADRDEMPHPGGERRRVGEHDRRHGQHAAEDESEKETRVARVLPGQDQREAPLRHEKDAENAIRAQCEMRHDFVTHFTGASLALR